MISSNSTSLRGLLQPLGPIGSDPKPFLAPKLLARQQSVLRCLRWSAPQSIRFKAANTCELTAYFCKMILRSNNHSTASWPNICAVTTLTDMLLHLWFQALYQASLCLCRSGQIYAESLFLHVCQPNAPSRQATVMYILKLVRYTGNDF